MRIPKVTVRVGALVMASLLIATGCSKQESTTESMAAARESKAKPPVLVEPNGGVDGVQKGMI